MPRHQKIVWGYIVARTGCSFSVVFRVGTWESMPNISLHPWSLHGIKGIEEVFSNIDIMLTTTFSTRVPMFSPPPPGRDFLHSKSYSWPPQTRYASASMKDEQSQDQIAAKRSCGMESERLKEGALRTISVRTWSSSCSPPGAIKSVEERGRRGYEIPLATTAVAAFKPMGRAQVRRIDLEWLL